MLNAYNRVTFIWKPEKKWLRSTKCHSSTNVKASQKCKIRRLFTLEISVICSQTWLCKPKAKQDLKFIIIVLLSALQRMNRAIILWQIWLEDDSLHCAKHEKLASLRHRPLLINKWPCIWPNAISVEHRCRSVMILSTSLRNESVSYQLVVQKLYVLEDNTAA